MKECPICHELNGDGRDVCFKCKASLDFKVYRADDKNLKAENIDDDTIRCYHCGTEITDESLYLSDKINQDGEPIPLSYNKILCKNCKRKRIGLIVLFVSLSIIASFIALLIINTILITLFQFQLGYFLRSILVFSFVFASVKLVNNIIYKPKKCQNVQAKVHATKNTKTEMLKQNKKSKQVNLKAEYDRIASMLGCDFENCVPIDWLSIQSFLYANRQKNSKYLGHDNSTIIDTIIFTCYALIGLCTSEIKDKEALNNFIDDFKYNIQSIISQNYNINLRITSKLVNNRFEIYEKSGFILNNNDADKLLRQFKNILFHDLSNDNIDIIPVNEPLSIMGITYDLECYIDTASYYSAFNTVFKSIIPDVIDYYNKTSQNLISTENNLEAKQDFSLLSHEEKIMSLNIHKYILEDLKLNTITFPYKNNHKPKHIHYCYDDTIHKELRVPKFCRGKFLADFDFDSTYKKVISTLPLKYHNKHLINIFSLAFTIDKYYYSDFLHYGRLNVIDTIIYTTVVYLLDLQNKSNFLQQNAESEKQLLLDIAETINYFFNYKTDLVVDMICTRLEEYFNYINRTDALIIFIGIFSKHIQYEYTQLEFSFAQFPYKEMKNNDQTHLIQLIQNLTDNIIDLNKE